MSRRADIPLYPLLQRLPEGAGQLPLEEQAGLAVVVLALRVLRIAVVVIRGHDLIAIVPQMPLDAAEPAGDIERATIRSPLHARIVARSLLPAPDAIRQPRDDVRVIA